MVNYSAYMALVVSVILMIVAHAWFVRRLARWRDRSRLVRENFGQLHAETLELAETVGELERGKESNAVSLQALEREIEELEVRFSAFLGEHPELEKEFGKLGKAVAATTKSRGPHENPVAETGEPASEG